MTSHFEFRRNELADVNVGLVHEVNSSTERFMSVRDIHLICKNVFIGLN